MYISVLEALMSPVVRDLLKLFSHISAMDCSFASILRVNRTQNPSRVATQVTSDA